MINSCELFEGKLQKIHTGIEFGSIHPKLETFQAQTLRILEATGKKTFVAQKLEMRPNVILLDESNLEAGLSMQNGEMQVTDGFFRPIEGADGIVFDLNSNWAQNAAFGVMNADSTIATILTPDNKVAFLHCGLNSVDPLNKTQNNNVTNAIALLKSISSADVSEFMMHIGDGVNKCHYGFNDPRYEEANQARHFHIAQTYGQDAVGTVLDGPRKGGYAFSIQEILRVSSLQNGLREDNVIVDTTCTACSSDFSFSHTLRPNNPLERGLTAIFTK